MIPIVHVLFFFSRKCVIDFSYFVPEEGSSGSSWGPLGDVEQIHQFVRHQLGGAFLALDFLKRLANKNSKNMSRFNPFNHKKGGVLHQKTTKQGILNSPSPAILLGSTGPPLHLIRLRIFPGF